MPLHDWSEVPGWDGVHQVWMVELLYWIKPRLPAGYRAYIGTTPAFAIGAPVEGRPDVGVRDWPRDVGGPPTTEGGTSSSDSAVRDEPDVETVVATLSGDTTLLVERQGRLVAAIELVSPRNKDRASACAAYAATYAGYLLRGIHLLLVDVHPRPLAFSFADRIAGSSASNSRPARPRVPSPTGSESPPRTGDGSWPSGGGR